MKNLKYLKKFENFYLNDNDIPEEEEEDIEDNILDDDMEEMDDQRYLDRVKKMSEVSPDDDCESCDHDDNDDVKDPIVRRRVWGDEVMERKKASKKKEEKEKEEDDSPKSKGLSAKQKKLPKALQAAILKRMKK